MSRNVSDTTDPDEDAPPPGRRLRIFAGVLGVLLLGLIVQWYFSRPAVPDLGQVSGILTLDGKPVPNIQVAFLPDPTRGTMGDEATAFTGPDGAYRVQVDRFGRDGAVVGVHRVLLREFPAVPMLPAAKPSTAPGSGPPRAKPPTGPFGPMSRRIPGEYEDLTKTPLRPVEVKPGEQTYDIALTSPPKK